MYNWSLSIPIVPNYSRNEPIPTAAIKDIYILLPSWVHMPDAYSADGMYTLSMAKTQGKLELSKTFEPFNVTITIMIDDVVYHKATFEHLFLINQICDEGKHMWLLPFL